MPYRSEEHRGYMHAKHPEIAARWDRRYGGKIVKAAKRRLKSGADGNRTRVRP